jgi:hypothetical protein
LSGTTRDFRVVVEDRVRAPRWRQAVHRGTVVDVNAIRSVSRSAMGGGLHLNLKQRPERLQVSATCAQRFRQMSPAARVRRIRDRPTPTMHPLARPPRPLTTLLLCAAMLPAAHAESVASSASFTSSTSVGALSGSVSTSSEHSSESSRDRPVAQGLYEVEAVADVRTAEGEQRRATLRPLGAAEGRPVLFLTLPRAAAEQAGLAPAARVQATPRRYGVEFARAETGTPFFLALHDEWLREIAPQPVRL